MTPPRPYRLPRVRPEIGGIAIGCGLLFLAGAGLERFAPEMTGGGNAGLSLFCTADLAGVALFAFAGAFEAARWFAAKGYSGILKFALSILAGFATATAGGGIVRDALLSSVEPWFLSAPLHVAAAIFAALIGYASHGLARLADSTALRLLDHAALGVFAAGGASIIGAGVVGVPSHETFVLAFLFAGATAAGGGVLRDLILLRRAPVGLTSAYALSAATGGLFHIAAIEANNLIDAQVPPDFLWIVTAIFVVSLAEATRGWRMASLLQFMGLPTKQQA